MIQGDGFFQVSMPDGTIQYTRDGSFKADANGRVCTSEGYPLEPAVTIPSAATGVVVTSTGQVQITLPSPQPNQVVGQIQLARFTNPAGLSSQGQNLYTSTEGSGDARLEQPGVDGTGTLSQGFLETSNVQVTTEMVNLITCQRAYEVNTKAITASDQMLNDANQLGTLTS
jgi:flagellar basal-body rod protein FlgG